MAYSITAGNSSGYFAINSSTGEITLHASGVGNLSGPYVLTRHDDVGNTNQQITVTIIAAAATYDAAHPLTETIGAASFSWTPSVPMLIGQDALGEYIAVLPSGSPTVAFTPVPTTRTVTGYNGTPGSYLTNGAHLIRYPIVEAKHSLDERMPGYDGASLASSPCSPVAGDTLITSLSMDDPGTSNRHTAIYAARLMSFVEAIPTAGFGCYRPPIFGTTAAKNAAACLAPFNIADLPSLSVPTQTTFAGTSVAYDRDLAPVWPYTNLGEHTNQLGWRYGAAEAYGVLRGRQTPGSFIYEAFYGQYQTYGNASPASIQSMYGYWQGMIRQLVSARTGTSNNAERQAVCNSIVQHALDWLYRCRALAAQGTYLFDTGEPHGGHVPVLPIVLLIGAYCLNKMGRTADASAIYTLIENDQPTSLDGTAFNALTARQNFVNAKRVDNSYASSITLNGGTATLNAPPSADIINFGLTGVDTHILDWNGLHYVDTDAEGDWGREALSLIGQAPFYLVQNGIEIPIPLRMIWPDQGVSKDYFWHVAGTGDDWDGKGGYWHVRGPQGKTLSELGIVTRADDTVVFRCLQADEIDFADDAFGGPIVATLYQRRDCYTGAATYQTRAQFATSQGVPISETYFAIGTLLRGYIAMHGLQCSLWTGQAQTGIRSLQDIFYFMQRLYLYGSQIFDHYMEVPYSASWQELFKTYVYQDRLSPTAYGDAACYWDAPTVTSVTGTQTGQTTADISFSVNEPGTAYWAVLLSSASEPTAAQIRAGTGALDFASISVGVVGTKTDAATGLTANTSYKVYVVADNNLGDTSSVVASSTFTTASAAYSPTFIQFDGNDWAYKNYTVSVGTIGMLRATITVRSSAVGALLSIGWAFNDRIWFYVASGNVGITVRNAAGTPIGEYTIGAISNGTHDIVVAWDSSPATTVEWSALIDGASPSGWPKTRSSSNDSTASHSRASIGSGVQDGVPLNNVDLGIIQAWLDLGAYPDLTDQDVKDVFYSGGIPQDPALSETMFGASSINFFDKNAAQFNAGNIVPGSPAWTSVGAVSDV